MESSGQDPLLAGLRDIGLNRYEASVYLGLVTDQTAKVTEISKRTGVPQPKVYQALDSLVEKGFCSVGTDSINRYQPVPPRVAMESHLVELRRQEGAVRQLSGELEVLLREGQGQERWAPPIEIVKGIRQISQILVDRIHAAREDVLFFGKGPIVPALEVTKALWDAASSGIRMRLLFEQGYVNDCDAKEEADLYRDMPGEKREVESLPSKLVVIDRQIALVSISRAEGSSFLMLMLRHEGLLSHFVASFDCHWSAAKPWS